MSDASPKPPPSGLFAEPPSGRSFPTAAVTMAAVAVVVVAALLLVMGRRHGAEPAIMTVQPLARYAPSLQLTGLQMSESTSLSGGKSTFIDGHITNHGDATVTGLTVQVLFASDPTMPAHVETLPLSLIRTREPYVDTEPVSAAPLAPGGGADFRLIFENVPENWNGQLPEIHIIKVMAR